MYEDFFEWLDGEIVCVDKGAYAFAIIVYSNKKGYAAELIGANSFDDEDDDCIHDTMYSSRAHGDEFKFAAESRKKAFDYIGMALKEYLKRGARSKRLKGSHAVACGLQGGALRLLYRR